MPTKKERMVNVSLTEGEITILLWAMELAYNHPEYTDMVLRHQTCVAIKLEGAKEYLRTRETK